ncbi:thioredoxin family protein [bacterium]|nr:thioredoxin family protein [bacterium]
MPIRILVYGKEGDGAAFAAMAQIRSLVNEMRADCSVQIVTDPGQLRMNGIEDTPSVMVDGSTVSMGYVPSRTEMQRYIQQRMDILRGPRGEY